MVAYHEEFVAKAKCDEECKKRIREQSKEIYNIEKMEEDIADSEDDKPENVIQGGVIDRAADSMDDLVNANRKKLDADTEDRLNNDNESLNTDQKRDVGKLWNLLSKEMVPSQ